MVNKPKRLKIISIFRQYFLYILSSLILLFAFNYWMQKVLVYATFLGNKEQREAAKFLLNQIEEHYGVELRYKNFRNDNLNTVINNYLGDNDILDSLDGYAVRDTFLDKDYLKTSYLIDNINLAFSQYDDNPLGLTVPDSIFYEYILPYRVGDEKLGHWRNHYSQLYNTYLRTFEKEKIDERFIVDMVEHIQRISYHVYDRTGMAKYTISTTQSLDEIRQVAYPYSCDDYATFKLYSFRSIGLAAAFETVPLYGKFNFGHSETALWHRDGKFHCTEGKTDMPYKFKIAKMYRRQFSQKENSFQKILETGENAGNIPNYFNMPYYKDITNERTLVSDVVINPKKDFPQENFNLLKVGYLCVYNNGEWKPVEWSDKKENHELVFRNMGRKILYHMSTNKNGKNQLIGAPFLLDSIGNIRKFKDINLSTITEIKVRKYDRENQIEFGEYELFYWDESTKRWKSKKKFDVLGNCIILTLAENVLYKIEPKKLTHNPRPFSIENNEQIWW